MLLTPFLCRFLYRHVAELGQLAERMVKDLFPIEGGLVLVTEAMTTIDAFATLLESDVSGVGITSLAGAALSAPLQGSWG